MRSILQETISTQRKILVDLLKHPLCKLVLELASDIHNATALETHLHRAFPVFQHCKYLYVMDAQGIQITQTIFADGSEAKSLGRDRSQRPYMQHDFSEKQFALSEAYISKHNKRPSITAIHVIKDAQQQLIGYLGVDYDLRELPGTNHLYKENYKWQQIKGDPAIRSGLFAQQRMQSDMDNNIDNVLALMQALICEHGVFHGKFHFSSSRTTVWLIDDPYNYRLLSMNELNDPDICLAYPRQPYSDLASVPTEAIPKIFEYFRQLRFADETIYLRAGSINIVNGMISLNFSCDGSHYLPYQEFLDKGMGFWFGTNEDVDPFQYDEVIETICAQGCDYVYQFINQHRQGNNASELNNIPQIEQDKIVKELETIMQVYSHKTD
ncbi:PDC sensor domain-containing protein [sulfur-oxidizing endosymbiont of Gigantopelta aegis]|uniref:PDC sensor domain-containing protein n=1 Tax=sulfur-oxidizing endosymbiont of Gigantopelta aegis TaxID=2794934 RepID=UPI0018DCA96F|nr:PDC sensor domain-containing protein [sulfur-oxidizing endosymbiont of Gigantopelta aegis]